VHIPSEADFAFARRAQVQLSQPATRTAMDSLTCLNSPKLKSQLDEMAKHVSALSVGIDSSIRVGLDFDKHVLPLLGQSRVLQQALTGRFKPELRISALDAAMVNILRNANSTIKPRVAVPIGAVNYYDKAASDLVAGSLLKLSAAVANTVAARQPVSILNQARSALGLFDGATSGLQARLRMNVDLTSKLSALSFSLATSDILSAQIELAATKLMRTGDGTWGELPAGSVSGLARLSSAGQLGGASPGDLMSVARGVYGLTSFAARAAEVTVFGESVAAESDDTVEDWSDSTLSHDLRSALNALHPALAAKLEGAWEVYRRRGPDALGQAATSLVELIDRSMDLLAPAVEVAQFAIDNRLIGSRYITDRGNPTVALKVRFVLRARPLTAEAVDAQVAALTEARKRLQASKHLLDFNDDLLIGRLLLTVENVFTVILLSEG
jgi:hypothetical protein